MSERFYDDEIAPALLALANRCQARGMPFLAIVEYEPDSCGRTEALGPNPSLDMIVAAHAAKTGANIDGFMMGLARYVNEHGIPIQLDRARSVFGGDPTPSR